MTAHCPITLNRILVVIVLFVFLGLAPMPIVTRTMAQGVVALSTCDFSDDFSNPSSGWPTFQGSNYDISYDNGRYKMQMTSLVFWISKSNTFCNDPSIEVDTTVFAYTNPYTNNIRHGILFRYTDVNNWYAFEISSEGSYRILKRVSGSFTNIVPWTFSNRINQGLSTNRLSVRVIGNQITVGVNGQTLTTTTDTSFSSGLAGLTAGTSVNESIGVYFDNFVQTITGAQSSPIVSEARLDIGMPYNIDRGCPSPYVGCGQPFHGFANGVCTDLVMDAYNAGAPFNIQNALRQDYNLYPERYLQGM